MPQGLFTGIWGVFLFAALSVAVGSHSARSADPPSCAISPTGVCTRDINPCGHPSQCNCSSSYAYNQSLGLCVLDLQGVSQAKAVEVPDGGCVTDPPKGAICTRDINACGNPSSCTCEEGFAWNDVVGKCLKVLSGS